MTQVPGKPETIQGCEGNAWSQNGVGFCEDPGVRLFAEDKFYKSLLKLGTRHWSAIVFHVAEKCKKKKICVVQTWEICTENRSCSLRSVHLCNSGSSSAMWPGSPRESRVCKCHQKSIFLPGTMPAQNIFLSTRCFLFSSDT